MSKLIIMQETVNFMASIDPESVTKMGDNWERKGEDPNSYYLFVETPEEPEKIEEI